MHKLVTGGVEVDGRGFTTGLMGMESMDDPKSAYHADALACAVDLLHVAGAYVNAACSLSSMRYVYIYSTAHQT